MFKKIRCSNSSLALALDLKIEVNYQSRQWTWVAVQESSKQLNILISLPRKTNKGSSHSPPFSTTELQMTWEPKHWQVWGGGHSWVLRAGTTPRGCRNCSPGSRSSCTDQRFSARICKWNSQTCVRQELSNPSPKEKGGGTPLLTSLADEHWKSSPRARRGTGHRAGRQRNIPSEVEEQAQVAVHTNSLH